jgi:hypothetical protein
MNPGLPSRVTLILTLSVLVVASSVAVAGQTAPAKPSGKKAPAGQEMKTPAKKKPAKRKGAKSPAGIPKGVQACIDRLIAIASAEPFPAYGGQAEQIINGGLLWDNPKSKCSIGSDQSLRSKVSAVATAWREKNAEKVRSLLQELKSAAPQG